MSTRDEYVSGIKSAFVTIGSKALMGALVSALPFMASPFLKWIASKFINWILNKLAGHTEMAIFFKYIDVRTDRQGMDFEKAAFAHHAAQINGTPEEKAHAEAVLLEKFRIFARLNT